MIIAVLIVVLTFLSEKLVNGECADGFIRHGDSCYHFSRDTETWFDALVACERIYHGHLAEIQDANENNFLNNAIDSHAGNNKTIRYWIGGSDLQVEGEWKWYTSNTDVISGTWYPGNPSGGTENCLEIVDADGNGPKKPQWNDLTCHAFSKYICEMSVNDEQIVG